MAVKQYKQGYGWLLRQQGFEEGSAVPWEEADVIAIIDRLDVEAAKCRREAAELEADGRPLAAFAPTFKALLLDRDVLACTPLWGGIQRGKEGGALALPDLTGERGQEVLRRLGHLLKESPGTVKVSSP